MRYFFPPSLRFTRARFLCVCAATVFGALLIGSHAAQAAVIRDGPITGGGVAAVVLGPQQVLAADSTQNFFVSKDFDWKGRTQISATIKAVGAQAYFFVEDEYFTGLNAAEQNTFTSSLTALSGELDSVMHPRLTSFFGGLRDPGIDGESRIFVLVTRMRNEAGGYVNTADEYSSSTIINGEPNSSSNEKELIYFNAVHTNSLNAKSYLAHEFQHLISFNQKEWMRNVNDDIWLNEVRSEYAVTYLGYNSPYRGSTLENRVATFASSPVNSLTAWVGVSQDYGPVAMFAEYIAGRYGSVVFQQMMQLSSVGVESVEQSITALGQPFISFDQLVLEWHVTNFINDAAVDGTRFLYVNSDLANVDIVSGPSAQYTLSSGSSAGGTRLLEDWSPFWIQFFTSNGAQALNISFSSVSPQTKLAGAAALAFRDNSHEVMFFSVMQNSGHLFVESSPGKILESVTLVALNAFSRGDFSESATQATVDFSAEAVGQTTPFIVSLSQFAAFVTGGTEIVFTGGNFTQSTEVLFGEIAAANVEFIDGATLRVTTPILAQAGPACIIVRNGSSSISWCGAFEFFNIRPSGVLLRASNDPMVWITNSIWRRHIMLAEIFSFYVHLSWDRVLEAPAAEIALYRESAWVRADGDPKVYELNADLTKHWVNMTAEEFTFSGRVWEAVYVINAREHDFYTTGADVFFR